MEPPAPEALRGLVQNVESIFNLMQTSSIIDELPGHVPMCHTCFSKENQVHNSMHASIKFHAYSDI
jgi:hypothetical protein